MSERNRATIWATKVEGRFNMMILSTGGHERFDKHDLTAVEVVDYLLSGPLIDILEFDVDGKPVNHEAIHAEARRRDKSIGRQRPCGTCGSITMANPSCPECGAPWTSA